LSNKEIIKQFIEDKLNLKNIQSSTDIYENMQNSACESIIVDGKKKNVVNLTNLSNIINKMARNKDNLNRPTSKYQK